MPRECGADVAEAVDSKIAHGEVTAEVARAVEGQFPQAAGCLADWIRSAAAVRDWRRAERFANLGAALGAAPGLGEVLVDVLDGPDLGDLNQEDLVEILGEIKAVDAADTLFRVVRRSIESDAPAFWLCQKAIFSLSEFETDEARRFLREMTTDSWPNVLRWYAAVGLDIEDELGFDEDAMLG